MAQRQKHHDEPSARTGPPAGDPGTGRSRPFRIVVGVEGDWEHAAPDEIFLICPWLDGLDPVAGPWLAALPIHDCNAFIDSDWSLNAPEALRARCYLGLFALDRLRSARQIFGPLSEKKVPGLVNLPSIGFFDGATAQIFGKLSFTLDSEIAFLAEARRAGFRTGLCAPAAQPLPKERLQPFDFVLRHALPGDPLVLEES